MNTTPQTSTELQTGDDPYLWLEDIRSERIVSLSQRTKRRHLAGAWIVCDFEALRQRLLAIFDSKERIPSVDKQGAYYYNLWRGATYARASRR